MNLERVRSEATLEQAMAGALLPDVAARPRRLGNWLRLALARLQANALLRRTLKPMRKTRIDELSPYILRDIGWPPR
ncbi:MAG: hypothetical protein J0I99_17585 [Devosia sp.]|uniref:hypothetical protein n=1 Tax=Devosia sp. TaxID=1871048 RepID=UPI001AD468F7|nr:hypothetical protein [Devosia sp.]MBN9317558.1 hypothetical protein [Devosia sp.]